MAINKNPVREALAALIEARESAEMKTASFVPPSGEHFGPIREVFTEQVRKSTRLWRETWILSPLDEAIAILEKELAK